MEPAAPPSPRGHPAPRAPRGHPAPRAPRGHPAPRAPRGHPAPRVPPRGHAAPRAPLWRRAAPFVIALGLAALVLARIDWATFLASVRKVDYPTLLLLQLAVALAMLAADAIATVHVYRKTIADVRFSDFVMVRGTSYLPSLLNHHVGQAWLTYFLSRQHGVPLARVAGATLVVYVSWLGCLLLLAVGALATAGLPVVWTAAPLALGVAYLVLLRVRPAWLADIDFFRPLFDVGVGGHISAMALRLPHLIVTFVGSWLPFGLFGIEIPFSAALSRVSVLMVAVAVPLTPVGLGTRDALASTMLEPFVVAGGSHDERLATIAAATMTTGVTLIIVYAALGLAFMRFAARGSRTSGTAGK